MVATIWVDKLAKRLLDHHRPESPLMIVTGTAVLLTQQSTAVPALQAPSYCDYAVHRAVISSRKSWYARDVGAESCSAIYLIAYASHHWT